MLRHRRPADRKPGRYRSDCLGAVADEIASAAELVMGKVDGVPAAVVRGLEVAGDGRARDLVIPEERDLFR